jgi:hypothetical protein
MPAIRTLIVSSLCGFVFAGCGAPAPSEQAEPLATRQESLILPPLILNYLYNPGFETPDPFVPTYQGMLAHGNANAGWFAGWASAAENWPATSNDLNYGTVTTWLTNEHYGSSGKSMLIAAGTNNGGVSQVYWQSTSEPPLKQKFTVRVKVVAGQVTAGIGRALPGNFAFNYAYSQNDPNTVLADGTVQGPQWETLTVCAPVGIGANQVLIYSIGAPAVYYVDAANVFTDTTNCP